MKPLDDFLNGITMYRLTLYLLGGLAVIAIIFGATDTLQQNPVSLIASAAILLAVCYGANLLFAKLYDATANAESALITALILFCIFSPPRTAVDAATLAVVALIAMGSKYILAWQERHVFNPAAIAAVIAGWLGLVHASWWIANDVMLLFVFVAGFLVIRKLRHTQMAFTFLAVGFAATVLTGMDDDRSLGTLLTDSVVSWPLLFLGAFMLTEPMTTPPTRWLQIIYASIVGVLVGVHPHVGPLFVTPELALVLGNIVGFATGLHKRLPLKLIAKHQLAPGVFDFEFAPGRPLHYHAGQYLELTLPLSHRDARGNRRSFTVASSPTEPTVHFGIKIPTPASQFKTALAQIEPGSYVFANRLAGNFTLPTNADTKLAFIAGGIGVTPFRSMAQYLIDTKQVRDAVLFYVTADPQQLAYKEVLEAAKAFGLRCVYVLHNPKPDAQIPADWSGEVGPLTMATITKHAPDYAERRFYLSGPPGMVGAYKTLLRREGRLKARRVVTDYFSGY